MVHDAFKAPKTCDTKVLFATNNTDLIVVLSESTSKCHVYVIIHT